MVEPGPQVDQTTAPLSGSWIAESAITGGVLAAAMSDSHVPVTDRHDRGYFASLGPRVATGAFSVSPDTQASLAVAFSRADHPYPELSNTGFDLRFDAFGSDHDVYPHRPCRSGHGAGQPNKQEQGFPREFLSARPRCPWPVRPRRTEAPCRWARACPSVTITASPSPSGANGKRAFTALPHAARCVPPRARTGNGQYSRSKDFWHLRRSGLRDSLRTGANGCDTRQARDAEWQCHCRTHIIPKHRTHHHGPGRYIGNGPGADLHRRIGAGRQAPSRPDTALCRIRRSDNAARRTARRNCIRGICTALIQKAGPVRTWHSGLLPDWTAVRG